MSELKDQREIIKTIRWHGGYAKKWATRYISGVPDLVCSLPSIGPFFLEIKVIMAKSRSFKRSLSVTPKQRYEMTSMRDGGAAVFIGLVVKRDIRNSTSIWPTRLFLLPPATEIVYTPDKNPLYPDDDVPSECLFMDKGIIREVGGHYKGLRELLEELT